MPEDSVNGSSDIQTTHDRPKKKETSLLREIINFILIVVFVLLPIRFFVFQPFMVVGSSMEPTFFTKDYLIVDELSYRLGSPQRGQVTIFKFPGPEGETIAERDAASKDVKYFIKRIIGLPGETVDIKNGVVTIKNAANPDGFTLDEPYVQFPKETTMSRTLAADEYFVMGDNRDKSYDSRSWGPVKREYLVGKAFLRLYPIGKASILPGNFNENK